MDEAISHVHTQLLASDLRDSAVRNTGLPAHFSNMGHGRVAGTVLVQIMSITDIGHSAFSLQSVRQTRMDRADLNGLVAEDREANERGPNGIRTGMGREERRRMKDPYRNIREECLGSSLRMEHIISPLLSSRGCPISN